MSAVRSTGKAVGVIELEDGLAGDGLALELPDRVFEQRHAVLERLGEALLFLLQHAHDVIGAFRELGIGRAHFVRERGHERWKNGFCWPSW